MSQWNNWWRLKTLWQGQGIQRIHPLNSSPHSWSGLPLYSYCFGKWCINFIFYRCPFLINALHNNTFSTCSGPIRAPDRHICLSTLCTHDRQKTTRSRLGWRSSQFANDRAWFSLEPTDANDLVWTVRANVLHGRTIGWDPLSEPLGVHAAFVGSLWPSVISFSQPTWQIYQVYTNKVSCDVAITWMSHSTGPQHVWIVKSAYQYVPTTPPYFALCIKWVLVAIGRTDPSREHCSALQLESKNVH